MLATKHKSHLRANPKPTLKIGKGERTRALILNAALDFTWSHPFHEMTVNSLMASTDLSRATFYQYFSNLHELMEDLLNQLQDEIFDATSPWLMGTGDPVALVYETMNGLVRTCYDRGPFLRATFDAVATDNRFDETWRQFLGNFDEAVCARIKLDQEQGLIPDLDPFNTAFALNRLDAYTIVEAFGKHPRAQPEPVCEALARIWASSLYGDAFFSAGASNFVRT